MSYSRHTKWGGRICNLIEKKMSGMGSGDNAEGEGKMLAAMATQIPIRNFVSMSMGAFSPQQAAGLLMILNEASLALMLSFGDLEEQFQCFLDYLNQFNFMIKKIF